MKTLFVLILMLGLSAIAFSQVTVGTTSLNKVERTAVVGDFGYAPDIVEAVLLDDLKTLGFGKGDSYKGFRKYANIQFYKLSPDKIDFYFLVDQKNKKEKENCTVSIVISKGGDNFINNSTNPEILEAAKSYLSGLDNKFSQQKVKVAFEEQTKVVEKADKEMNSLISKNKSLNTKLKDVQSDLEKNQKEQETQKALLEKEKLTLENLKKQLK